MTAGCSASCVVIRPMLEEGKGNNVGAEARNDTEEGGRVGWFAMSFVTRRLVSAHAGASQDGSLPCGPWFAH